VASAYICLHTACAGSAGNGGGVHERPGVCVCVCVCVCACAHAHVYLRLCALPRLFLRVILGVHVVCVDACRGEYIYVLCMICLFSVYVCFCACKCNVQPQLHLCLLCLDCHVPFAS
jgi:hypothetical protein